MTAEERELLEALWVETDVTVEGVGEFVCGCADNPPPARGGFVVITSDEPFARPIGDEETLARRLELATAVRQRGWDSAPAVGMSPDGRHAEHGVALWDVERDEWLALAQRFEQLAVFVVDADGAMRFEWCD